VGLGATVNTSTRKIPADQFFKGLFETALAAGEMIKSVTFPIAKKAAYEKFKNPASRFAIVGVFVAQTAAGPRVAVTGAGARGVFRVKAMEEALAKSWSADAIKSIAVPASDLIRPACQRGVSRPPDRRPRPQSAWKITIRRSTTYRSCSARPSTWPTGGSPPRRSSR
jgi:CO/xanthine dehydrogenase FAD-binding subunit